MKYPIKKLIYLGVGILALICIYSGYAYGERIFPFGPEKYQAVQLINGDVYYGKLKTFPCCKLKNVYFIQQIPLQEEGEQPATQLMPLNSLFFGPENIMYLEKSQILWWADLAPNSQILQTIKSQ